MDDANAMHDIIITIMQFFVFFTCFLMESLSATTAINTTVQIKDQQFFVAVEKVFYQLFVSV